MSNSTAKEFITPIGRIVAGDVWEPRTKDFDGNDLVWKSGANEGKPRQEYFIGLAIPKTDAGFNEIWALMCAAGREGFPNMFDAQGNCVRRDFAFKYTDGDSTELNRNGVAPNTKEGYPGHWVLSFTTSHAPKVFDRMTKPLDPSSRSIKRGDYVRIAGSTSPNGNQKNPGIYMNLNGIQFSHAGEEISSGFDAAAAFGASAIPAAPAGANTTPTPSLAPMPTGSIAPAPLQAASAAPNVPGNLSAPAGAATPPNSPGAAASASPSPVQGVQPARDFLNGPSGSPAAPAAPAAPAPVVESFIVEGNVYTRDQLIGGGWTDAQINAQPRA